MATVTTDRPPAKTDVERLHELGYAQELRRRMSGFSNFAISFTIISVLSGCMTAYLYAMNTGGPPVMSIGWPLVGVMVLLVGLAMARRARVTCFSGRVKSITRIKLFLFFRTAL